MELTDDTVWKMEVTELRWIFLRDVTIVTICESARRCGKAWGVIEAPAREEELTFVQLVNLLLVIPICIPGFQEINLHPPLLDNSHKPPRQRFSPGLQR